MLNEELSHLRRKVELLRRENDQWRAKYLSMVNPPITQNINEVYPEAQEAVDQVIGLIRYWNTVLEKTPVRFWEGLILERPIMQEANGPFEFGELADECGSMAQNVISGELCDECGSMLVQTGTCKTCSGCGKTGGCG